MATFLVLQGPDKGRTFRILNEPAVIGRKGEQIPLVRPHGLRRHAELRPDNGSWVLVDLQSANGTYVNGVRVREPVRLKHGDQIKIGSTLIVYSGDQSMEKLSGSSIPADMIDLDASDVNMDSAILASVGTEDSVIIAGPELTDAARAWRVMSELTGAIGAIIDPDQLLERVMDVILEELPVDRGFILLYDKKGEELVPHVVRYRRGVRARKQKITTSHRIIQHVLEHRAAVLCTNAMTDPRFATDAAQDSIHDFGLHSVICAPIMARDLLLGVIHIDCTATTHTYTEEQLRLMSAIGQMTGLAIQNARLVQQQMQTARLAATGETVAYLSHYIKNILQGMQSGADLVDMGLSKPDMETVGKGWEIVQRNLDRILGLTMNMLAFSKQREPKLQPDELQQDRRRRRVAGAEEGRGAQGDPEGPTGRVAPADAAGRRRDPPGGPQHRQQRDRRGDPRRGGRHRRHALQRRKGHRRPDRLRQRPGHRARPDRGDLRALQVDQGPGRHRPGPGGRPQDRPRAPRPDRRRQPRRRGHHLPHPPAGPGTHPRKRRNLLDNGMTSPTVRPIETAGRSGNGCCARRDPAAEKPGSAHDCCPSRSESVVWSYSTRVFNRSDIPAMVVAKAWAKPASTGARGCRRLRTHSMKSTM